jgi:hypothetical protein
MAFSGAALDAFSKSRRRRMLQLKSEGIANQFKVALMSVCSLNFEIPRGAWTRSEDRLQILQVKSAPTFS